MLLILSWKDGKCNRRSFDDDTAQTEATKNPTPQPTPISFTMTPQTEESQSTLIENKVIQQTEKKLSMQNVNNNS